jgi:iron complex transport system substrate-binding protein
VKDLPRVGYKRSLSAEGILALRPDLLLANDDVGPPEVMQQIQAVGVEIAVIPDEPTVAGLRTKVRAVARVLNRVSQGEQLVARLNADLAEARRAVQDIRNKPRILFLLHIGSGADMSGGRDTVADAMIQLAGGVNVMRHAFTGYKPITPEAVVAAAPEIVLMTKRNLVSLGGKQKVIDRIGLANTPAGREGRVVAMDGLFLLGFGPRTGQAVAQLADQLHGWKP